VFSKYYIEFDKEIRRLFLEAKSPSKQRVTEILEKSKGERLELPEIAELLEIGANDQKEQFQQLRCFTRERFRQGKNMLRHISPVYLSNICIDTCSYCQFSARRTDTQRTRLSLSDLEEELQKGVLSLGSKVIEFTLATDSHFTPEILAKYIGRTKEILGDIKGRGILLCSDYLSTESYAMLQDAGLWGVVQWDETFDETVYRRWHRSSPRKSNMKKRMDNHDRALSQGLQVATGVLLGLADYRYDVLMNIAKSRYIESEYGIRPFVFGTPRLKSIHNKSIRSRTEIPDEQYETVLMIYKISEPEIGRWLQTRESFDLNIRNLLHNDVYTYKCGEVKPGGYYVNASVLNGRGSQFKVEEIEKPTFEKRLAEEGFELNYAWVK